MSKATDDIIEGHKTFFVAAEPSLLPDSYLADYLARGYEIYVVPDDRNCPLHKKVEAIISIFQDAMFFFYIDAKIPGISWEYYIKSLQEHSADDILIGVLYLKRNNETERKELERYYLFDVGIQCGCIALEYQKAKNFLLIERVMFANQASGKRKNVRAICDANSKVTFSYNNTNYSCQLNDISLSHFSCTISGESYIPQYEKVNDALIDLNGLHFKTDAILMMQRLTNHNTLLMFIFVKANDQQGLDEDLKPRLAEKIYQLVTSKVKTILQLMFDELGRSDRDPGARTEFRAEDFRQFL